MTTDLRWLTEQDLPAFLELYEEVMEGLRHSPDWFRWKYSDNPYVDDTPIIGAFRREKLVGARAHFALPMGLDGERCLTLQPTDTMVRPDYRRRGIFTRMTEEALSTYEQSTVRFMYNFPNSSSRPGNLKLGWNPVERLTSYYQILRPGALLSQHFGFRYPEAWDEWLAGVRQTLRADGNPSSSGNQQLTIRPASEVDPGQLATWWSSPAVDRVEPWVDEEFLRYRLNNPDWEYRVFTVVRDGDQQALLLASSSDHTVYTRASVLAVKYRRGSPNPEDAKALLEGMVDHYSDHDVIEVPGPVAGFDRTTLKNVGFWSDDEWPLRSLKSQRTLVARPTNRTSEPEQFRWADPGFWSLSALVRDKR